MDNTQQLLHPNLLENAQLKQLIKERQLHVNNVEELSRNELIDIFKMHIMPKPQRQSKTNQSTNGLAKEVKKIKLNRTTSDKMEVDEECAKNIKRISDDQQQTKTKRQRIQWP